MTNKTNHFEVVGNFGGDWLSLTHDGFSPTAMTDRQAIQFESEKQAMEAILIESRSEFPPVVVEIHERETEFDEDGDLVESKVINTIKV